MKKTTNHWTRTTVLGSIIGLLLWEAGCSSSAPDKAALLKTPGLPSGVTLHQDKDINGVWLAAGVDFRGYDALYIENPLFAAVERPNEAAMRSMALRLLPQSIAEYMEGTKLFPLVTLRADDVKPGVRSLKLENTVIEYEKGGGGARYWAGMFGGGQPVIKVRGRVLEGEKLLCVYELRRSGESAGARLGGVWLSDEEIQRNDIRDLASDLADFFKRTAKAP